MFAKLAVAPEAILEQLQPGSLAKSIHLALLDTLNAHGELLFRSNEEALRFIKVAKKSQLPGGIAKRWEATLIALHKMGRIKIIVPPDKLSISMLSHLSDLEVAWSGKVGVIVLASDTAAAVGVPADEGILDDAEAHIEIATIDAAIHTQAISRLRQLADSVVFPFDRRDLFWESVLEPVAEVARSVTILDKFLLKELWRRATEPSKWRNREPEHVVWLLRHLDCAMREQATVRLIAYSSEVDLGIEDTAELIRQVWEPPVHGRLDRVELTFATFDRGFPHDRHIRFDAGSGISINAGFDRLRQNTIWDQYGMSWSYAHHPADLRVLKEREDGASRLNAQTEVVIQR